jgi:hypothetical protein
MVSLYITLKLSLACRNLPNRVKSMVVISTFYYKLKTPNSFKWIVNSVTPITVTARSKV